MPRLKALVAAAALVAFATAQAASQAPVRTLFGASVADICGTVKVRRVYGPPNFGEAPRTDARLRVVVLALQRPLLVDGSTDPALPAGRETARRTQLLGPAAALQNLRAGPGSACPGWWCSGCRGTTSRRC